MLLFSDCVHKRRDSDAWHLLHRLYPGTIGYIPATPDRTEMQSLHSVGGDVSVPFPGGSTVRSRNHEARVEISFAEDVSGGSYYVSWSDPYHVRLFQRGFFRPFELISCPELEQHLFLACGPVWFETLRDVTFAIPITPGAEIAMLLFASIEMARYGMKPVLMRMVKGVTGCSNYRRKSWL